MQGDVLGKVDPNMKRSRIYSEEIAFTSQFDNQLGDLKKDNQKQHKIKQQAILQADETEINLNNNSNGHREDA